MEPSDNPIPLPNPSARFPENSARVFRTATPSPGRAAFAVWVGVPERLDPDVAAAVLSLQLCNGTTCSDVLEQSVADVDNDWASTLTGDLAAGYRD